MKEMLSYKSTIDILIQSKKLIKISHSREFSQVREFYCLQKLYEERISTVDLGYNRPDMSKRRKELISYIDDFISDDQNLADLFKPLVKTSIFELKVIEPKPGFRFFGGFLSDKIFIGLDLKSRDDLKSPKEWNKIVKDCENVWLKLFPHSQLYLPKGSELWNK